MILYPTETLYALGVNALAPHELAQLYHVKGRDVTKVASWLVRNAEDIARYATISPVAAKLIEHFLPGPLTLVLQAHDTVPRECTALDGTVGFRISSDPVAAAIIEAFMAEYDAPLTCTSANVSGASTYNTTTEILQQFAERAQLIDEVHDDGPRKGLASTVVRVRGDDVTLIREGSITEAEIDTVLR